MTSSVDIAEHEQLLARLSAKARGRETCANGHPWTPENTRWRKRGRGGRHGNAPERDCLACLEVSRGHKSNQRTANKRYM